MSKGIKVMGKMIERRFHITLACQVPPGITAQSESHTFFSIDPVQLGICGEHRAKSGCINICPGRRRQKQRCRDTGCRNVVHQSALHQTPTTPQQAQRWGWAGLKINYCWGLRSKWKGQSRLVTIDQNWIIGTWFLALWPISNFMAKTF